MYKLIHSSSLRRILYFEAPSLAISLAVAEFFYKFGSFLFECVAFLATWYAVSLLFDLVAGGLKLKAEAPASPGSREEKGDAVR
jgi:hypothetical protein